MRTNHLLLLLLLVVTGVGNLGATRLKVKMDRTSPTMTLIDKSSGSSVETGEPLSYMYEFDIEKGEYQLTGYNTKGDISGTIDFKISGDSLEQQITVLTNTLACTNKDTDGRAWVYGEDFTIDTQVYSREGEKQTVTLGNSTTAGRKTCLAYNGNTIIATFSPSDTHRKEGYTDIVQSRTLTAGITLSVKIPQGGYFTIPAPKEAGFELNQKFVHFTDFKKLTPTEIVTKDDVAYYTYYLAQGQVYNYRTWMEGKLTQGGYFTYPADSTKMPEIGFTMADYEAYDPKQINHSPQSNSTYETGDIFVNADYHGMVRLGVGESFKAHAMRTWELTDNSTNNYFIEPDFHYAVYDLDGNPCSDVIDIDTVTGSAWADITAKKPGTVIVTVTYDAIALNYYSGKDKKPYLGGPNWGAIWPENTATYIVSVGQPEAAIVPNMTINEKYNYPEGQDKLLKNAGKYVDAEHDVFYYLDTDECAHYTFTPEGVESVTIAYPTVTDTDASFTGFASDGVTRNEDGSYTLALKHGRQIVKLTDAAGNSIYQVLRARRCTQAVTNVSRPGSKIFQPGDQVKVQFDGLYHPANKIAGIYNMSAYVTYNGVPNGTALILGANQYNFGGVPKAQAVDVVIPEDYDAAANPVWTMDEGVIQVNGFGDPIGNHRHIDPVGGRSPNFTAIAHKTYFGYIPPVSINLSPFKQFEIKLQHTDDADVTMTFAGKQLIPGENGLYEGTYGTYSVVAKKKGYRCFRHDYTIGDDAEGLQTFDLALVADADSWDGTSVEEAQLVEDTYHVTTPAQLAWIARQINGKSIPFASKVSLDADIQLGGYDWTAIGLTSATAFQGEFNGNGHTVDGLYVNAPNMQYQGLFGYFKGAKDAPVKVYDLTVNGSVLAKAYVGGIVGSAADYTEIDRVASNVTVTGSGNYVGGLVGMISGANSKVSNSYNTGNVSGTSNSGGIAGGSATSKTTAPAFENLFNLGEIVGGTTGGCVGSTGATYATKVNLFSTFEGRNIVGQTTVTSEQMASGEIAWMLGEAFGQTIGEDAHPMIGGAKVYKATYILVDGKPELNLLNGEEATSALYTNGDLPRMEGDNELKWYTDASLSNEVTTVTSDTFLYLTYSNVSGIDSIGATDNDADARWYRLDGIEIPAPAKGTRGVFIRVTGGNAEKVVL